MNSHGRTPFSALHHIMSTTKASGLHPPVTGTRSSNRSSGSNNSSASSPSQQKLPAKKKPGKPEPGTPKSQTVSPHVADKVADVSLSVTAPPVDSKRTVGNVKECPCGTKTSTTNDRYRWMIDCSQCGQYWHLHCVSFDGLTDKEINKMLHYKCPFCYVAPIPTLKSTAPGTCFSCRNTEVLRSVNNDYELNIASRNIKAMCSSLNNFDLESFSKNMSTLQDFDVHLKHLLLNEEHLESYQNSVRNIEAKVDAFSKAFSDEAPARLVPSFDLITEQIEALQTELEKLTSRETPPPEPQGQPVTVQQIEALQTELEKLTSRETPPPKPQGQPATVPDVQAQPASPASLNTAPSKLPHNEKYVENHIRDFTDSTTAEGLTTFLDGCSFKSENGHSVVSFGEPYSYTGSQSPSTQPAVIPEPIKQVVDKINHTICAKLPQINQCLVNRYTGPDAFLPEHADDEQTIHPESLICTLSLGSQCTVKFRESDTNQEETVVCDHASLYSMTKRSQNFYQHRIETGSIAEGTRYSLTFRSVSRANKNSTCVIGDSNTCNIKFGTGKGTLGYHMPGKQVFAPHVKDIDPLTCLAYSNVVIGGLYRPNRRLGSRVPGSGSNERRYSRADVRRVSVSSRDTRGPPTLETEGYQAD